MAASAPLHRQDGAEGGLAVRNPLIRLRSFGQRIRFDNGFYFCPGHKVERSGLFRFHGAEIPAEVLRLARLGVFLLEDACDTFMGDWRQHFQCDRAWA